MRTNHSPAVFAGFLAVLAAAFVLLGFGVDAGAFRPAASVRADVTVMTVCPHNMSWDGAGCR
jgi:hypothetical protein